MISPRLLPPFHTFRCWSCSRLYYSSLPSGAVCLARHRSRNTSSARSSLSCPEHRPSSEKTLNRIWGTYPRSFLHGRAVNFLVMTIAWGLLGTSAVVATFVTAMRAEANKLHIPMAPWVTTISGFAWQSMFMVGSLILTVTLFTILYKMLPNTAVPISEALTGAVIAGVLWEAAKFGFAYLLPYFHYDLLYGSIGAAVALLTWVYLSSIIMLFGAQFTALLHRDHLLNPAPRHSQEPSESRFKRMHLTGPRRPD